MAIVGDQPGRGRTRGLPWQGFLAGLMLAGLLFAAWSILRPGSSRCDILPDDQIANCLLAEVPGADFTPEEPRVLGYGPASNQRLIPGTVRFHDGPVPV